MSGTLECFRLRPDEDSLLKDYVEAVILKRGDNHCTKQSRRIFDRGLAYGPSKVLSSMPFTGYFSNIAMNSEDTLLSYWGSDLRCRFANAAYGPWFGRSAEEMYGLSKTEFLGSAYEACLPRIQGVLNGISQEFEQIIHSPDGRMRHGLVRLHPDFLDGTVQGFFVQVKDITRTKQLEMELEQWRSRAERLAGHDYLTGLPNRHLLIDRIEAVLDQAKLNQQAIALTCIHLDNFASINQTYGYEIGDSILKEIARRMTRALLPAEMLVRLGEEKFLLIVPNIRDQREAHLAIDRLRKVVEQPLQYRGASLIPSFSCGTAVFPQDGKESSELLARAEQSLRDFKDSRAFFRT